MSLQVSKNSLPHVYLERGWAPTHEMTERIAEAHRVDGESDEELQSFVDSAIKLSQDAVKRDADLQDRNIGRSGLNGKDELNYLNIFSRKEALGYVSGLLAINASRALADELAKDDPAFSKITFELFGKTRAGVEDSQEIEEGITLLGNQIDQSSWGLHYWPLPEFRRQLRFKFSPYFEDPDHGNTNFTDGWVQVREPLGNVCSTSESFAPINIFRQQDLMVYLPRSDSQTQAELEPLSAQGWDQVGQDPESDISRVTAKRLYDRFVGNPANPLRDMLVVREQVLMTVFR